MPTHGKATSIVLGAYVVHQWFNSISTTETQDVADTTPFQVNDKTYVIGPSDAKVSASGRYEGNVGEIRTIVKTQIDTQGESVITVGWGMGGPLAGNVCEFGKELHTGWTITAPVAGIVTTALDTQVDDGLAHGVHLFDLVAAKSATYTGPTEQLQGGAYLPTLPTQAIAPGMRWAAAFHRLAATGTAVSVVKVQTSADGTTWVDLPGATYTFAATVTGSQLVSGTANTAGPYVRAVETITGTGTSQVLAAFGLY